MSFWWHDYRDDDKDKLMTLDAFEFIRRFLLHILPHRYVRLRDYGLLCTHNRKEQLKRCQEIIGVLSVQEQELSEAESWQDWLFELTGIDPRICPNSGKRRMVEREIIKPLSHPPPKRLQVAA